MTEARRPKPEPWDADFVLDRNYRFVTTAKVRPITGFPTIGRSAWDILGGEELLRPTMERVWVSGEPWGWRTYYDGVLLELHAERVGRYLRVRYRVLREVRVTTLNTLLEDMQFVAAELNRPYGSPRLTDLRGVSTLRHP